MQYDSAYNTFLSALDPRFPAKIVDIDKKTCISLRPVFRFSLCNLRVCRGQVKVLGIENAIKVL